jgi:N-acetylneuraminate synthase
MREVKFGERWIGEGHPPFLICELSANHNGSLERALELVDAAADTGCDAIKIQTYTPDSMTIDCDRPEFFLRGGLWDGRSLYDLYKEAQTPWEWHPILFERARQRGVAIFSTPFDEQSVDALADLGVPGFKIASFELIDLPLIRRAASHGRPLIISTGMASLDEMKAARDAALGAGAPGVVMLHCVSGYPTPLHEANLATIPALAQELGVPVGLSDHTLGTTAPVVAVALGAAAIEKHFTLRRADGGPDAAFSLEPQEFAHMVAESRRAAAARGSPHRAVQSSERGHLQFRRSLVVVQPMAAGEAFTEQNLRSIRPGLGLSPALKERVMGRVASRAIGLGEPLDWSMVLGGEA